LSGVRIDKLEKLTYSQQKKGEEVEDLVVMSVERGYREGC